MFSLQDVETKIYVEKKKPNNHVIRPGQSSSINL